MDAWNLELDLLRHSRLTSLRLRDAIDSGESKMNTKHRSLILAFIFSIPFWASAQTQQAPPPPSSPENLLLNLFFTVLPIVLIGAFIWFFFIRQMRGMWTQYEANQRHHEAVEKLLERIAIALEKNNKNPL